MILNLEQTVVVIRRLTIVLLVLVAAAITIVKYDDCNERFQQTQQHVLHQLLDNRYDNDKHEEYVSVNANHYTSKTITATMTRRKTQSAARSTSYYYQTSSLGYINKNAGLGNPMKGLIGNGGNDVKQWPLDLPSSMQGYKIGLNSIMLNDPDVVGENNAFNWTSVDNILQQCSEYKRHAVIRFYGHWPGQPLKLPSYLLNSPYDITLVPNNNELVPYWGDIQLLKAIQQFIKALGTRYDGDRRLFVLHAGLVGAWGEHHAQGCKYGSNNLPCDPEWVYESLSDYFKDAFQKTHIQFRYPNLQKPYNAKFGFHDDSYTKFTVGGIPNGGIIRNNAFWNMAERYNASSFWKWSPMGGEVHPENIDCFQSSFPNGTEYHQEFKTCTETAHATYMSWNRGFRLGGVGNSPEQDKAKEESARMGYNYVIKSIGLIKTSDNVVTMDVTIEQIGVAPFYYDLFLNMFCDGGINKVSTSIPNAELQYSGDITTVSLQNIQATSTCFSLIELQLGSTYTYIEKPIKWAQNNDGRVILTDVPLPTGAIPQPVQQQPSPVDAPIATPVPFSQPIPQPVPLPAPRHTPVPQPVPVPVPVSVPTSARQISGCYLVCAGSKCSTTRLRTTSGNQFLTSSATKIPINSRSRRISQRIVGKELSIVCDMMNTNSVKVSYAWPTNKKKTESHAPYSMGGDIGSRFTSVKYLSTIGDKSISVRVYNKSNIEIDSLKLIFSII
jgi:hypothetical protein